MLIYTREDWRRALRVLPTADTPLLVDLVTNGQRPYEVGSTLHGVGVCAETHDEQWPTWYVPLSHPGGRNADPGVLGDILSELLVGRPILVADANEFTQHITARWPFLPQLHADYMLAHAMLGTATSRVPVLPHLPAPASLGETPEAHDHGLALRLSVLHRVISDAADEIVALGLRTCYQIELHAWQVLARSTAQGYAHESKGEIERVHPSWTVVHPSGSGVVTARQPAVTSMTRAERRNYPADPGCRWVAVNWQHEQFTVAALAARCGAPYLVTAANSPEPYTVLGDLWGIDAVTAGDTLRTLIITGPDEAAFFQRTRTGPQRIRQLAHVAPEWVEWGSALHAHASEHGTIRGYLGRTVNVEPAKACYADVSLVQTTLLKMLISRLHVEATQQPAKFARFHAMLPVHSAVSYQIDTHVPVEFHVPLAQACATLYPCPAIPLRAEVLMGRTWGGMTRVDNLPAAQAQAAQDLSLLGPVPVTCSTCGKVAPDQATLDQHMEAEHP